MTASNPEQWQADNDAYLGLALTWLRLVLERAAPHDPGAGAYPAALPAPADADPGRRLRWRSGTPASAGPTSADAAPAFSTPPALGPATVHRVTNEEVDAARRAMDAAAAAMSPPAALARLGDDLGLSGFERDTLLLAASADIDTRIPAMLVAANGSPYPSLALALALFDDATWDVRSPDRPLRFWRLVDIVQSSGEPLVTSRIQADERVVNALRGLDHLDGRLSALLEPLHPPTERLPPSQDGVVAGAVARLVDGEGLPPSLLEVIGADRDARDIVASTIAARIGVALYRLPVDLLPTAPADVDLLARLVHREAVLWGIALLIDVEDLEERSASHVSLTAFLRRARVLTFLGGRDVRGDLPLPSVLLDVAGPTPAEQQAMWEGSLQYDADVDVTRLVAQFDLDAGAIRRIAARASTADDDGRSPTDRLWDECRRHSRPRLESLAQRLDARAGWDGLVLPETELALLHAIADQVGQRGRVYEEWGFATRMSRGLGISALFAGESGTGKTMAAEVLANELALDLYRIDLSSVVSKYIGETEKNLRRLFDAAERGGVILFFDEADALFGKRSEVKDAHDRYANIEISYLLQRMEAYRGLAILATNMKSALDRAFTRRLRFVVDFPFPGVAERARMWSGVFPAAAPVDVLDHERLARLNLTGAAIANAALHAAFLAAKAGHGIGMPEVLAAAREELRKAGRPINEADFRLPEAVSA